MKSKLGRKSKDKNAAEKGSERGVPPGRGSEASLRTARRGTLVFLVIVYLVGLVDVLTDILFWWQVLPGEGATIAGPTGGGTSNSTLWQLGRCLAFFDAVLLLTVLWIHISSNLVAIFLFLPASCIRVYVLCQTSREEEEEGGGDGKNGGGEDSSDGDEEGGCGCPPPGGRRGCQPPGGEAGREERGALLEASRIHIFNVIAFWLGDLPLTALQLVLLETAGGAAGGHAGLRQAALWGSMAGLLCKVLMGLYPLTGRFMRCLVGAPRPPGPRESLFHTVLPVINLFFMAATMCVAAGALRGHQ